jgi:hypothetical protein
MAGPAETWNHLPPTIRHLPHKSLQRSQHVITTSTATTVITGDPKDVASAISGPWGLANWYCGAAHSERSEGGRLYVRWTDGRHALGRWREFHPDAMEWTLLADDGVPSVASFRIAHEGPAVRVTVEGTGTRDDWPLLLENLKAFVETGRDARELRRPMMGIQFEPVTAELAAQRELPVEKGILITGLTEDGAARAAGIQTQDVLSALAGTATNDYDGLITALSRHSAGDVVEAELWRDGQRLSVPLELKSRPQRALPSSLTELMELVATQSDSLIDRLSNTVAGLTDAEAAVAPSPGEWSVKEVLAHLTIGERYGLDHLARMAGDDPPVEWPESSDRLLHLALMPEPLEATVQSLIGLLRQNRALIEAIAGQTPAQRVFHQLGTQVYYTVDHFNDHIEQIQSVAGAVKGQPTESP